MKPKARHKARILALQAIYQWQFAAESEANIKQQFLDKLNTQKVDVEYFCDLIEGVFKNILIIDNMIQPLLDRKLTNLDKVELAVLRLAVYELLKRLDVPPKVIINEALELTKSFGSIEGYKYINGVLDKVYYQLRTER